MDQAVIDQINAMGVALASFTTTKKATTSLLSQLVTDFNANAPRSQQLASLNAYVAKFNELTTASNALRASVAQVQASANAFTIGIRNLTDEQVAELGKNPQQYFAASYLTLVNTLLLLGQDVALSYVDMIANDLRGDIQFAYDTTTPPVPFPSTIYEPDHAFDVVNKAFASLPVLDAQPPS